MEYKDLIGKTIVEIKQKKLIGHDDDGYLEIKFSDNTKATIVAFYGARTGNSEGEYPTGIFIEKTYDKLEDINN